MAYTTIDKPSDYFNTITYTGNDTDGRTITGVGFQSDFSWVKARSSAFSHYIIDAIRYDSGASKYLKLDSSGNYADETPSGAGWISALNSDGYVCKNGTSNTNNCNENGVTYVAWNWKAGTSFTNDASSTGVGSIDSSGSVNTDAGFSIISYTGTGSNGTIAHGLGSAPQVVLLKERNGTSNWLMSHQPLSASLGDYTRFMTLNSTGAVSGAGNIVFQGSAFTSSVFNVGASSASNGSSQTFIAYCFAEKKGYSKFGSYTGNGNADGTFVYTGQKSAFVMIKKTSGTGNWCLFDNKRGVNGAMIQLNPDNTNADNTLDYIDFLSNGFKCRNTASDKNASGGSYIYMAFAENPFVTSTGVPATAR